jgi:NAD(P)H dehydrogenase (quinone)
VNVLTVFAHPGSRSFCHAVLDRFDAGLRDAGHTNEIVDLYAMGFDPILRPRDGPSWLTETIPDDMLERMRLRKWALARIHPGSHTLAPFLSSRPEVEGSNASARAHTSRQNASRAIRSIEHLRSAMKPQTRFRTWRAR